MLAGVDDVDPARQDGNGLIAGVERGPVRHAVDPVREAADYGHSGLGHVKA